MLQSSFARISALMREVVQINGATGTGKSTKLFDLLRPLYRVVAIDPAHDAKAWRAHGYVIVRDLPDLSAAICERYARGFRIVLFPPAHLCAEAADGAATLLFAYQQRYASKRKAVALAVDEMAECFSNAHAMRRDLSGMRRVILQGRHADISLYGGTQRPQDVATQFRDNAPRAFFFALYDATARERVTAKIGRQYAAQLAALKPFEFLELKGGAITLGKTKRA